MAVITMESTMTAMMLLQLWTELQVLVRIRYAKYKS